MKKLNILLLSLNLLLVTGKLSSADIELVRASLNKVGDPSILNRTGESLSRSNVEAHNVAVKQDYIRESKRKKDELEKKQLRSSLNTLRVLFKSPLKEQIMYEQTKIINDEFSKKLIKHSETLPPWGDYDYHYFDSTPREVAQIRRNDLRKKNEILQEKENKLRQVEARVNTYVDNLSDEEKKVLNHKAKLAYSDQIKKLQSRLNALGNNG
jgi:hypothetical protein